MRRLLVLLAPLLLVAGLSTSVPAAAGQVRWRGVITFAKNHARPDHSVLSWKLLHLVDGKWQVTDAASWRAGSGMLGKRGRNSCVHNIGWLPNGRYHVREYLDYHGSLIRGRTFRIDDMGCGHGTVRHNLFIHTEQGAHNTQCRNRRGDQPCRWEYPKINDYKSAGCIKLAPADLADLVRHYRRHFRPGVRYPKARVVLRVVDQAESGSGAQVEDLQ